MHKQFQKFGLFVSKTVDEPRDDKLLRYLYRKEPSDRNKRKIKSANEAETKRKEEKHHRKKPAKVTGSDTEIFFISAEDVRKHQKKLRPKHEEKKMTKTEEDVVGFLKQQKEREDGYEWLTKKDIFRLINKTKDPKNTPSSNFLKKFFHFEDRPQFLQEVKTRRHEAEKKKERKEDSCDKKRQDRSTIRKHHDSTTKKHDTKVIEDFKELKKIEVKDVKTKKKELEKRMENVSRANPKRHRKCLVKNTFSVIEITSEEAELENKKKLKIFKKYYKYNATDSDFSTSTACHAFSDCHKMYQDKEEQSLEDVKHPKKPKEDLKKQPNKPKKDVKKHKTKKIQNLEAEDVKKPKTKTLLEEPNVKKHHRTKTPRKDEPEEVKKNHRTKTLHQDVEPEDPKKHHRTKMLHQNVEPEDVKKHHRSKSPHQDLEPEALKKHHRPKTPRQDLEEPEDVKKHLKDPEDVKKAHRKPRLQLETHVSSVFVAPTEKKKSRIPIPKIVEVARDTSPGSKARKKSADLFTPKAEEKKRVVSNSEKSSVSGSRTVHVPKIAVSNSEKSSVSGRSPTQVPKSTVSNSQKSSVSKVAKSCKTSKASTAVSKEKPKASTLPKRDTKTPDDGTSSVWSRSTKQTTVTSLGSKSDTKLRPWKKHNKTLEKSSARTSRSNSTCGDKSMDSKTGTSFFLTKTYKDDEKLSRWNKRKEYADAVRRNAISKVKPQVLEVRYLTSVTTPEDKDFYKEDLPAPCLELVEDNKFKELFELPTDRALNDILNENYNFLKKDFSFTVDDLPKTPDELSSDEDKRSDWYSFKISSPVSLSEISSYRNSTSLTTADFNLGSQERIVDSLSAPGSEESGYSTIKSRTISRSFFERPCIKTLLRPPPETYRLQAKSSSHCGLELHSIESKSLQTCTIDCSQKGVQIKLSREGIVEMIGFSGDQENEEKENEADLERETKKATRFAKMKQRLSFLSCLCCISSQK